MSRVNFLVAVFALVTIVGTALLVRAADDMPKAAKEKELKAIKLVKPWNELTLTDDQKVKINDIHQKALAAVKEIHAKEEADIAALLKDDQKAQLKKLEDQDKADAKAKKTADAGKEKEEAKAAQ